MNRRITIGLIFASLILIASLSMVVAYSIKSDIAPEIIEETEYSTSYLEKGALAPVPERGIVRYSNPRYENGTMIDWESQR